MSDGDHDYQGHEAMVHALLDEELGTPRPHGTATRSNAAAIVARFAAGDGPGAARRRQAALAHENPTGSTWLASRWRHLCAAAALLAVAATFAQSRLAGPPDLQKRELQERELHRVRTETQNPKREPAEKIKFAEFQKMLTRVKDVHVEPLRIADYSLPFAVDISGTLRAYLPHSLEPFLELLPKGARKIGRLDAEWMNRVTFLLDDGSRVLGSVYPFSKKLPNGKPAGGVRLHVEGLDCDVRLGNGASEMLRDLLESTTMLACQERGVVLAPRALKSFPVTTKSLRLFHLKDEQLPALARYQDLRRLDCSGLRKTLGEKGLRAIAEACPKLEELVLDGMRFHESLVQAIAELGKLKKLSLRNVPTLTDKAVQRICERDLVELLLQGSGKLLTDRALGHLAKASKLTRLGVPAWPLPGLQQSLLLERFVNGELEFIKP